MKEIRTMGEEHKIDPRLRLTLALLHDACRFAPCYTWDDCDLFCDVDCCGCPIKSAIDFIEKEIEQ